MTGAHSHEEIETELTSFRAFIPTTIERIADLMVRMNAVEARLETPAPTPAPIPASDVTIWKAGSAPIAGVLGRHALPDRITKVEGGYQYEVRPTDGEVSGPGGRRAEEFGYHKWREGDEVSIVLKGLQFPRGWNLAHPVAAWAIHVQAAEYGSPHFQLKSLPGIGGGPLLQLVVEDGDRNFQPQWTEGLEMDFAYDIGLNIRWSQGSTGFLGATINGWEAGRYSGPTLSDTSEAYLKWGAYCGGGAARKVIIQDVRWAPGLGRIKELRALP